MFDISVNVDGVLLVAVGETDPRCSMHAHGLTSLMEKQNPAQAFKQNHRFFLAQRCYNNILGIIRGDFKPKIHFDIKLLYTTCTCTIYIYINKSARQAGKQ